MSPIAKVGVILLLLLVAAGSLFAEDAGARPVWPAYLFSILLGFGSGQYYLGQDGMPFLVADIAGCAVEIIGLGIEFSGIASLYRFSYYGTDYQNALDQVWTGLAVVVGGGAVLVVSRVFQIVGVARETGRARSGEKVSGAEPWFELVPVWFAPGSAPAVSCDVGLTLRY
jgi:hypothetical protein